MTYDIKTLAGVVELTQRWEGLRDYFFEWARKYSDDPRWQDGIFAAHMKSNYIDTDTPITAQFYNLDNRNKETVIRFINEYVMDGLASIIIDC